MTTKRASRVFAAAALATSAFAAPHLVTSPALASELKEVCADDLYVRNGPKGMATGTLYRGEHFRVDRISEHGWAEGYAYGNADKPGWVEYRWLCRD